MASKREQVIRHAEKLVSRGKIEAGIKEYRRVLAENPNDASTLNRVGDLYARLSRFDDAVRFFGQIAEQYTEDGFLVKAIAIYKKIIKLDPTRLAVYESLAELYHKQGLLNEARTQYQVLADYYLKHDDQAAAINIYQKMTEIEPDNPAHHLKLAELYQQGQLWEQAMSSYRIIAELLLRHGKAEEAARVFQRAVELQAQDLSFITDAVRSLVDAGHSGAAARLLAVAVELNPEAQRVAKQVGLPQPGAEPPASEAETTGEGDLVAGLEPEPEPEPEPKPPPPLRPPVGPSGWGMPEDAPTGLSSDSEEGPELILDLDDEPSSMVQPPPDMDRPGSAFVAEDTAAGEDEILEVDASDFELDLPEGSEPATEGAGGSFSTDLEQAAGNEGALSEEEGFEVEIELEPPESIEWEIDLTPDASHSPQVPAEESPGPRPFSPPPEAPPLPPPEAPPRVQDLMAEAEVFAKYGLEEKSRERLGQVLKLEPDRLEAHQLLLDLHLAGGDHGKAQAVAGRILELSSARGELEAWKAAQRKLERAGISLPGAPDEMESSPVEEDRVSKLLRSLDQRPERRARPREQSVDQALEDLAAEVLRRPRPTPSPPPAAAPDPAPPAEAGGAGGEAPQGAPVEAPPAAPPAPPEATASTAPEAPPSPESPQEPSPGPVATPPLDELELDEELPGIVLPEERRPEEALDDTGMDWLTEAPAAAEAGDEEKLFEDEDEFFDLAAELEEELDHEGAQQGENLLGHPEEPTLEEIVEGFKRGVAENLSSEDYDTHYNLGIAYREMGLLDEAIGEFQLAAKDPGHLVECCAMLGVCFQEKGLPELAVKWYQRGLAAPDVSEETTLSMLYDMGNLYLSMGDQDSARKTFVELYGMSSHYRDVVAKLEELGPAASS